MKIYGSVGSFHRGWVSRNLLSWSGTCNLVDTKEIPDARVVVRHEPLLRARTSCKSAACTPTIYRRYQSNRVCRVSSASVLAFHLLPHLTHDSPSICISMCMNLFYWCTRCQYTRSTHVTRWHRDEQRKKNERATRVYILVCVDACLCGIRGNSKDEEGVKMHREWKEAHIDLTRERFSALAVYISRCTLYIGHTGPFPFLLKYPPCILSHGARETGASFQEQARRINREHIDGVCG